MILKLKLPVIFLMVILMVLSCKKEPEYKPLSSGPKNSEQSSGMSSNTNESLSNELHAVTVKEILEATRYVYLKVEEGKELLKSLGIKGDYVGIGHCVLGYVDGEYPEIPERKPNWVYNID